MQGQILQANAEGGLILGSDGQRYRFAAAEWKGARAAGAALDVDFVASGSTAEAVFPLPGRRPQQQPWDAAIAPAEGNSVLLGLLGIGGLVLGFVIPVLPVIAAFILGLVGAGSARRYHNHAGLVLSRIAWIGALLLTAIAIGFVVWAAMFAWPLLEAFMRLMLHAARQAQTIA